MTEVAWFAALCDDDYEFLGVADPALQSSWDHCRDIVLRAEANGFDNVLLPSGYALGMDATAFAAAIAVETSRIKLLLAVRLGELVVPQLARQIATLQQIAGGRLVINAISSDVPGETLSSEARYQRTTESLAVLRTLLRGERADFDGEYVTAHVDAPRIAVDHPHNPGYKAAECRLSSAVEQRFCKPKVGGSIPSAGTISENLSKLTDAHAARIASPNNNLKLSAYLFGFDRGSIDVRIRQKGWSAARQTARVIEWAE